MGNNLLRTQTCIHLLTLLFCPNIGHPNINPANGTDFQREIYASHRKSGQENALISVSLIFIRPILIAPNQFIVTLTDMQPLP